MIKISAARHINHYLDKALGIRIAAGSSRRPVGIEDVAWNHIQAVKGRTMGSTIQQYTMWQVANHVEDAGLTGAIAEFGVWRGGMSMIGARVLSERNSTRNVYLFDTFEGMTAPSSLDRELFSDQSADELLKLESKNLRKKDSYNTWCIADFDDVTAGMKTTGIRESQYHLIQGDVLQTVPKNLPQSLAVCRIDTDWYESTAHIIENCWDLIVPGGVLILDDYDMWTGARKAVDDFFESRELKPLMIRPEVGRIIIKSKGNV
jgi:hypothetical protein